MALRQAARSVARLAARREGVAVRAFATNINQTYGLPWTRSSARCAPTPNPTDPALPLATQSARRRNPKSTRDPPRRAPRRLTAAESST